MAERDFKGVWIPKEIWLDERLTALEKVILVEIDSLDSTDAHCWKSNENLAEFCQCSATKVSNAISKLIKLGYVKVNSFDGRKRRLQSCLTFSVGEPYKNCKADLQKVQASNTYSNPLSNTDTIENPSDSCAEPEKPASTPLEQTVFTLPLNNGTEHRVTQADFDKYESLYPAVDVMQELRKMTGWLDGNPTRRKTKSGIKRFINSWLAKAQDQGGRNGPSIRGAIDRDRNKVPQPYGGGIIV